MISCAGAVGLCQLLPTTAKLSKADLLNPEINIKAGAFYLKKLFAILKHPLRAIAAYNAGEFAVKRWDSQNSAAIPMDYYVEKIPIKETRDYVKKVTGAWLIYAWMSGRLENIHYDP